MKYFNYMYSVGKSGGIGLLLGSYTVYSIASTTEIVTKNGDKIITLPIPLWGKILLTLSGAGYGFMANKMLFDLMQNARATPSQEP
jgi:hypothetical protein